MTYNDILKEIRLLSLEERRQLMHEMLDLLVLEQPKTNSIRRFRGVAAHLRDPEQDPQAYVNQLRDE